MNRFCSDWSKSIGIVSNKIWISFNPWYTYSSRVKPIIIVQFRISFKLLIHPIGIQALIFRQHWTNLTEARSFGTKPWRLERSTNPSVFLMDSTRSHMYCQRHKNIHPTRSCFTRLLQHVFAPIVAFNF